MDTYLGVSLALPCFYVEFGLNKNEAMLKCEALGLILEQLEDGDEEGGKLPSKEWELGRERLGWSEAWSSKEQLWLPLTTPRCFFRVDAFT